MKIAIFLLGAGGCGKTTTRKGFCVGEPETHRRDIPHTGVKHERYFVTHYANCSLAGNVNSGTDANTGPHLIKAAFDECVERSQITILDPVMGSPRMVEMVNDRPEDMHVLLVHFNLSQEEIVRRLMKRRLSNGKVEEALPEKTLNNSISFRKRAESTIRHFEAKCAKPIMKIEVTDADTIEDCVAKINEGIACLSILQHR